MSNCAACGSTTGSADHFCMECGAAIAPAVAVAVGNGHGADQAETLLPPTRPAEAQPAAEILSAPPLTTDAQVVLDGQHPARAEGAIDELVGQAAPNAQYLGNRLHYQEKVKPLDPLSGRGVKAMLTETVITFLWSAPVVFLLSLIAVIHYLSSGGTNPYTGVTLGHSFGIWGYLDLLVIVVTFVVYWFKPVSTPLSEWRFMVDNKGSTASQVFDHIAWAFARRHTPVEPRVRRLRLGGKASRDYLYVQDGVFRGYVAAFGFGNDLYVGWTFWWRFSPLRWMLIFARRRWQSLTGRGGELHSLLRYDQARALREALHGAAREGVDAACGAVPLQGAGTVGSDIPVELIGTEPLGSGLTFPSLGD